MSAVDDLLADIFEGGRPAFYAEFEGWVRGSRRYRMFATAHSTKIRAKLRNIRDEGGLTDLRAELETAFLLLCQESFTLEYEKYLAAKVRGPDFTVTFKTHTQFNIEVRRVRAIDLEDEDAEARTTKLVAILCAKVGQMRPGIVNFLWLAAERQITGTDITHAVTVLRRLAETKEDPFFTRRGFDSAAQFARQFTHLSGVIVYHSDHYGMWVNPSARNKPSPALVSAVEQLRPQSE